MKKRPLTSDTVARNIEMLIRDFPLHADEVAKKSGISRRMVDYILAGERKPTTETAEAIASAFGLSGWVLMVPDLRIELIRKGKLPALVSNYNQSSPEAQAYIESVAQREAAGRPKKPS